MVFYDSNLWDFMIKNDILLKKIKKGKNKRYNISAISLKIFYFSLSNLYGIPKSSEQVGRFYSTIIIQI